MKVRHLVQKTACLVAAASLVVMNQNCAPYSAVEAGLAKSSAEAEAIEMASLEAYGQQGGVAQALSSQNGASCSAATAVAFPGALGFGRNASGGRGGRVVFVTNTNDSGPGSLRHALEVETGRRIVVFKVGGVLVAKKQIEVRHGDVTIAGQTAPGNGFAMIGARLRVVSSNVIVRGMKIRPGDGAGDTPRNRDALSVGTSKSVTENVVIDHNSLTWAIDETLTAWYKNKNITFSYNLVGEPLYDSIHVDEGATVTEPHSMGTLIGDEVDRISLIRNVYSSANGRNPLIRATSGEVINNYVYNYGQMGTSVAGNAPTTVHILGNYYQEGPDTSNSRFPIQLDGAAGFETYVDGNLSSKFRPSFSISESKMLTGSGASKYSTKPVFASSQSPIMSASEVRAHLAANVGARWPIFDSADARIIDQALKGTGRRIDKVSQVGGMPSYPKGSAPVDTDNDGIPDAVEKIIGSNPNVKDDNGDADRDGYTNIEEYINGLITGFEPNGCSTSAPAPSSTPAPVATPAPTRTPASAPVPSSALKVEAEDFALTGFVKVADAAASNGYWIEAREASSAVMQFMGESGIYDLRLVYFDENDGVSQMTIAVGDKVISSFSFDQDLGSPLANESTKTSKLISRVALQKGDLVTLQGTPNLKELVRTDSLEFIPSAPIVQAMPIEIEAEDMLLSGDFKVGMSSAASGGKWIQSAGLGSAKIAFPGVSSQYDVRITYFDENDGAATMSFKVNGRTIKTWTWNKQFGSSLANSTTRTHIVIQSVILKKGDVIELSGSGHNGEPLRTDLIEFDPL
jgi:pectate lyase